MDRFGACKRASLLGIIFNIFLMVIKGIIGFITMSQAMIADFFNSMGDILASLMSFIGNKISSKKADESHNLGHGKAEYIYSMLVSVVMMYMSYEVIKDSIMAIFGTSSFVFNKWLIIVCIITIIVKLSLYIYVHGLYKKFGNILLEASSKDHRNDCLISSITLLSCVLSYYNISYIDSIIGIGISLWILHVALGLFKDSYDVLMDKTIDKEIKKEIFDIIDDYPEISKINHFNATPVGYQYQISFTIFVDGNLSTFDSHEIANKLEKQIIKEVEEIYLVVIHVNPN